MSPSSIGPIVVHAQMLIRRPAPQVFGAFIDPAVTTRFWFTKSTGPLAPGAQVRWEWEMYGASTNVVVKAVERDTRILIEWNDPPCPVEWKFEARGKDATFVTIETSGFRGSDSEIIAQALDSKGGFTSVLAGCKALLEHDVALNLVGDQFPDKNRQMT
jgi:uncharacterized protein YndB with AHSA1/START domain